MAMVKCLVGFTIVIIIQLLNMKVKIEMQGIKKTLSNLDQMEKQMVEIAYNKALQELGAKIGEITQDKVPLEEGILKSTYTVQKVDGEWVCGYNTEYAAMQHQGMRKDGTYIIQDRPGGGESFFLSGPVQANKVQLLQFLQERFNYHLSIIISKL